MIIGLMIWLAIIIGALVLVLLLVPLGIRVNGWADIHRGVAYAVAMDWALGFIRVAKTTGQPLQLHILGLPIKNLSGSDKKKRKKEKKTKEKKSSPLAKAMAMKTHPQTLIHILGRMTRAAFLRGHLVGRIGLLDPADTAMVALFCRLAQLQNQSFKLALDCVYDEEVIHIDANIQATMIPGYLALCAAMLLLQKPTRVMLHSLRHA